METVKEWWNSLSDKAKSSWLLNGNILDEMKSLDTLRVHPYAFEAMCVMGEKPEHISGFRFSLNGVEFDLDPYIECKDDVSWVMIRDEDGITAGAEVFSALPVGPTEDVIGYLKTLKVKG